jgi:hypothetical protein
MTMADWVQHVDLLISHFSKLRSPSYIPASNSEQNGEEEGNVMVGNKRIVFLATPSHPPRNDDYSRKVRDQRTNARLADWSAVSRDAWLAAGFPVIDSYDLTLPFLRDTIDNGHYRLTPAEEAMLQVGYPSEKCLLAPEERTADAAVVPIRKRSIK